MMQEVMTNDHDDDLHPMNDEKKTDNENGCNSRLNEEHVVVDEKAFPIQPQSTRQGPYCHDTDNDDDDEDDTVDSFVAIDRGFQCKIILLGQALSFLVACNAAIQSSLYLDCNLSAPSLTLGMFYLTLTASLVPLFKQQYYSAVQTTSPTNHIQRRRRRRIQKNDSTNRRIDFDGSGVDNDDNNNHHNHDDNDDTYDEDSVEYDDSANGLDDSETSNGVDRNGDGIFHTKSHQQQQPPKYRFLFGLLYLHGSPWLYLAMAVLDVYANFFMVLAYKYTTITSVTLFDALAIPSAMILSKVFLVRRYTKLHYIGVTAAMIGVIVNVFQDYEEDRLQQQLLNASSSSTYNNATHTTPASRFLFTSTTASMEEEEYPHKVSGDFLAITAGILVGANNVLGERAVRHLGGPNEYLGMVGLFAACICGVQTFLTETDEIAEFFSRGEKSETCNEAVAWFLVFAFVFCSAMVYVATSRFLLVSEATFLNLSLLTGDLWSVAFSIFAQRIVPQAPFFVALLFTLSGVLVYEKAPSPIGEEHEEHQPHHEDEQYPHDGHFQLPQRRTHERQIVRQSSSSYDDDDDDNHNGGGGVDMESPADTASHHHVD